MELIEIFENPKVLISIPFFLLFLFLKRGRKRECNVSSIRAYEKTSNLRTFIFVSAPYWLFVAAFILSVVAIAGPQSKILEERVHTIGYRVAITLDDSGSMQHDSKLDRAKKAISDFITKRDKDAFSFVPFGKTAVLASGIRLTTDRGIVLEAISRLEGESGSTALGDGYLAAFLFILNDEIPIDPETGKKEFFITFDQLKASLDADKGTENSYYREELRNRIASKIEGAFIVGVTDAENNDGIHPLKVIPYISEFGIPVFLVSVGTVQNAALVKNLKMSGGGYYLADSAEDIETMMKEIDTIKPSRILKGYITKRISHRPLFIKMIASIFAAAILLYAVSLRIK